MTMLITGTASGLGRYLHERLGGIGLSRETAIQDIEPSKPLEAIVHCAFSSNRHASGAALYPYLEDNLFLTKELTRLPHQKFVYISSVDVYPPDGKQHDEMEDVSDFTQITLYGTTKLFAESIVRKRCPDHLILRAGLLLGPYMRPNNLSRLVQGGSSALTLTADSTFNCILYSDVLALLEIAFTRDLQGTFNTVRADVVTLEELARRFNPQAQFGAFRYRSALASNARIASRCDVFTRSSVDAVTAFVGKRL